MSFRNPLRRAGIPAALVLTFVLTASSPSPAGPGPHQTLLARDEALVTVKFVLKIKMEGPGEGQEYEGEITCVLIDPKGLVLCSNTELGGYVNIVSGMMGHNSGYGISAAPSDLKVFIGEETEGRRAALLARDSDRDLAWVRIEQMAADETLPYLDFTRSAAPEVGQKFYGLRRLDKFFGSAPIVSEGTVGAVVSKPRRLLVPATPGHRGFGVPVFTATGELVGVTVLQMPSAADEGAGFSANPLASLGETVRLGEMVGGLILPADEVVKATRLARESFGDEEEEEH